MRRYHGNVIHRARDPQGIIEIVDDGLNRSLHFGNAVRQSAMDLSRPDYLVLAYTRAMASTLLFKPDPNRTLLIGLGGGSLARFILRHFPNCTVDAVERRELVTKLAHDYFLLPDDQRLRVHIADGFEFVRHLASTSPGHYDLILIDAYTDRGMDDNMNESSFLHACRALLTENGLMAINLWGRTQPGYNDSRRAIQKCFGVKPMLLPAEGTTNVIAMALRRGAHDCALKTVETHAKTLEGKTGLEMVRLARALRKRNGPLISRILA